MFVVLWRSSVRLVAVERLVVVLEHLHRRRQDTHTRHRSRGAEQRRAVHGPGRRHDAV